MSAITAKDDTIIIDTLGNAQTEEWVIDCNETGTRNPGVLSAGLMVGIALCWALFHIWVASPLPYMKFFAVTLDIPVLSSTWQRYFHLSFAFALVFMAYPMSRRSPRRFIPWYDWILGACAISSVMYLYILNQFFPDAAMARTGMPNATDIIISIAGIVILLEAARRSLGPPMVIIGIVFLAYCMFGNLPFIPELIKHKGQSLEKIASHMWITTEGVYGTAIGVSNDYVFLFVLFGALLEKAGAGNYFIQLAFSLLGHLRGGPAKAAVVSSAMTGLISGSSIANVVTTGTFTVPLMRKVGFTREKAGAVEVSSSVNGQLMPPVMGAAAFLMAEFTGVPYIDIVKNAFVPAAISYIALIYIVHLEAIKAGMPLLQKARQRTFVQSLLTFLTVSSGIVVFAGITYYAVEWIKPVFGDYASAFFTGVIGGAYTGLLWYSCKFPPLDTDGGADGVLPEAGPTAKTGLHYLLPIVVMVWCLMIEHLSPGLSAFWATLMMVGILATQRPMAAFFRTNRSLKTLSIVKSAALAAGCISGYLWQGIPTDNSTLSAYFPLMAVIIGCYGIALPLCFCIAQIISAAKKKTESAFRETLDGLWQLLDGLTAGARNMTGIAIATAAAGIIVGAVSLTGVGQVLTEVIETLSGGSFFLALVFTAMLCLILGMGLPTTANYIVVSSLMAGVLVELAGQSGIVLPLVAAHMFVFYYGIMADVTPPVGLASFAAAAVSGGDPIRTGIQSFIYSIRTLVLPFLFVYNTNLLLIGDIEITEAIWVFLKATFALLVFTAATQRYMFVKNTMYETAALLLVAFSLFNPYFWTNLITPEYKEISPKQFGETLLHLEDGTRMKAEIFGFDNIGDPKTFFVFVEPQKGDSIEAVMSAYGLTLREDGNRVFVDDIGFNSTAENAGLDFEVEISRVFKPQEQMQKIWIYILAFAVFAAVARNQRKRARTSIMVADIEA